LTKTDATDIKYVTIIGNFGVTTQSINPNFQQTGNWFSLLEDNAAINVTNVNSTISLAPGEFKVYGNSAATLSNDDTFFNDAKIVAYPNPSNTYFKINTETNHVLIFDLNGKKVKEFKGNFKTDASFSTQSLESGIYFVKINTNSFPLKLIKK
jgi:hypothetical protein